jgi:nucleotide-binding universal stress UspA family protein
MLMVRPRAVEGVAHREVPPMFGRILLAVDGSPQSEKAAQLAAKLAAPAGNNVVVMHVIELVPIKMGPAELERCEDARQLVERYAKHLADASVSRPSTSVKRSATRRQGAGQRRERVPGGLDHHGLLRSV